MNIPNNIQKIQQEETAYNDILGARLARKIGASLNGLIDSFNNKVVIGAIQVSALTESLFQSRNGIGWVLMKGQDITGSEFHALTGISILPNAVDDEMIPRTKNNGSTRDPDGERSLLSTQGEMNKNHNHWITSRNISTKDVFTAKEFGRFWDGFGRGSIAGSSQGDIYAGSTLPNQGISGAFGGKARPESYGLNFFIRINSD